MSTFAALSQIFNTAYILYYFVLGFWAGAIAIRGGSLGGQFWGAMWIGAGMGVVGLVLWLARSLTGEQLRWVYLWYELFFILVLPGTFALLRGRNDRSAAAVFSGIAIFAALSAFSAGDPSRGVIAVEPTPLPTIIAPTPTAGK